jgi:drug/metabolite transporter (DMT)-like permease
MSAGALLLFYYRYINRKKIIIHVHDYSYFIRIILFHIFCSYTLEFWALEYVTSAKACLLFNLSPFITALLSYFLYAERLTFRQLLGLTVGFLGFIPILCAQGLPELLSWHFGFISLYELALIGSVIFSAYGWIMMKELIQKGYSFIMINGIGMLGGGILSFALSLYKEGWPMMKEVPVFSQELVMRYGNVGESIIMLGIYSCALILIANIICYNLYGYLLSRYSLTFLSFSGFMTPLFAALLGWLFLGEQVTWHFFATICLVFAGLYLFHEKKPIEFEKKGL